MKEIKYNLQINSFKSGYFKTSDGAKLNYLEAGSGQPLVMIPGWSQTAEQFKYQIEDLSTEYHCIAVDMRGHGDSENVEYGYRIQRLAKDLREFLSGLELNEIFLLGHSMGCSVIWSYWDMFGSKNIRKLVLVDEPPFLLSNPAWSDKEYEESGALTDPEELIDTFNKLSGPDGESITRIMLQNMFSATISANELEWIISCNLKLPRRLAAKLILNNSVQDWRDVIPRINVPTLVVGAKGSQVSWKSQKWIHKNIPGSVFILFEESEGGKHFMFYENPEKFNRVVKEFLG